MSWDYPASVHHVLFKYSSTGYLSETVTSPFSKYPGNIATRLKEFYLEFNLILILLVNLFIWKLLFSIGTGSYFETCVANGINQAAVISQ